MNILKSVNDEQRKALKTIFDLQISEYSSHNNYVKWHPATTYRSGEDLLNDFQTNSINVIKDSSDREMMHVFAFSFKNVRKFYRILNLNNKELLNTNRYLGIRVLENTIIPMHYDTGRNMVREHLTHSITLRGQDSIINFSDKNDGSKLLSFSGLVDWSFYPTRMPHGAITSTESLDILQISME